MAVVAARQLDQGLTRQDVLPLASGAGGSAIPARPVRSFSRGLRWLLLAGCVGVGLIGWLSFSLADTSPSSLSVSASPGLLQRLWDASKRAIRPSSLQPQPTRAFPPLFPDHSPEKPPPTPALSPVQLLGPRPTQGEETGPVLLPPSRSQIIADTPNRDTSLPMPARLLQPPQRPEEPILPMPAPEPEPPPRPPTREQLILLGAARTAARQGNWDLAISRFQEYFRLYGESATIREEFAGVLVQARRTSQAIEQYWQLLQRQPGNNRLRTILGNVYVLAREYQQAIAQYQQVLQARPEDVGVATRLARAHFFLGQIHETLKVYDRYLAKVKPGDEKLSPELGALLIDLGWYDQALPLLEGMKRQDLENVEILAQLVRLYTRQDNETRALETFQELAGKKGASPGLLLDLAETLYESGENKMAQVIYQHVLQSAPGNGRARVGLARVALEFYHPREAWRILKGFQPDQQTRRIYRLAWAQYHQVVGEYTEAQQLYLEFLHEDANDLEVRLAQAKLLAFIKEFEKAKAEYAKIPPTSRLGRESQLGLVAALDGQFRLDEAIAQGQAIARAYPDDGNIAAQLIRTLGKARKYEQAFALAANYLDANRRNIPGTISVRFALGKVLLDAGKPGEALGVYRWLVSRPDARLTETYYGLAVSTALLTSRDVQEVLPRILPPGLPPDRTTILLAELFYRDNQDRRAIALVQEVLARDPHNLAALIRLADAQLRVSRFTADITPLLQATDTILQLSPTNVRGHLARARAFATVQNWNEAVIQYDRLIGIDPQFLIPRREKARVLFSDHAFAAADYTYQQLQTPPADALLARDVVAETKTAPLPEVVVPASFQLGPPAPVVQADGQGSSSGIEGGPPEGVGRALKDHQSRLTEQQGAALEEQAKRLKDLRNMRAVPVYQQLIDLEPGNEEALFDLGQVYGGLKQTRNALLPLSQVLEVEPQHRESLIALERASLEISPQMHSWVDFFNQRGRDGLAQIARTKLGTAAILPFGDENEFIRLGFARVYYRPSNDPTLDGNIFTIRAQKKFIHDQLLAHAQLNYEHYEGRLDDRPTFDAGGTFDVCDLLRVRATGFLENVVENSESLRQDIYRLGATLGLDIHATRYWNFGGMYRLAYYSDENYLNQMFLYKEVNLSLPPRQLKLVGTVNYLSYSQQTIFPTPQQDTIVGAVHPYFAPASYAYYEGRIEWYHWISRDYFTYSNQCWYSLQYGIGWDSRFVSYHDVRAILHLDLKSWLTVGVQAQALFSEVYESQGVQVYAVLRLPGCK
jgi:tetratricopeptide (TPR) repeat protein